MKKCMFLFFFIFCVNLVAKDVTIDIVKNVNATPNIQVVLNGNKDGSKIYQILKTDLRVSGHFNVFYDDSINEDALKNDKLLHTFEGKNINLIAQISYEKKDSKAIATLVLYDMKSKQSIVTTYMRDSFEEYPFLAHSIAVYLNDFIKADSISWMNTYVIAYDYASKNNTNILLTDYTMTYKKIVISGGMNLFPKWANNDKRSFYYTKITDEASIYKYNLDSGENTLILSSRGMAVVSDVSKDGNKLLLSLAPDGLSDIYLFDMTTKDLQKLTTYSGIDVNANFIDNESAFAFVSDRLGYPTIFRQSLGDNARVEQLVFQGRNNSSLSSYNNYIVYSSREGDSDFGLNTFNLYLVSTQSDYIRRLSTSGTNTVPKFGKDGDTIMYLKNVNNEVAVGIIRISNNKSFLFPLKEVKLQGFDW